MSEIAIRPGPGRCCPEMCYDYTGHEGHVACCACGGPRSACDGYGCTPARLMLVGLSAGRLGALVTRVPFTKDASGRILQRCLRYLNLSKTDELSLAPELVDTYITNLVKARCLTPEGLNRPPTEKEVVVWTPQFIKELKLVQPRVIVPLGKFVVDRMMRSKPIFRTILDLRSAVRPLPHPRWYQARGALKLGSKTFDQMVEDYRQVLV